jgi:hypothetical protein
MRGLWLILLFLILTATAGREARISGEPQPPGQPSGTRLRWIRESRLYRFAAWFFSVIFALGALLGTADELWGPVWPTSPEIESSSMSATDPFAIPLLVSNESVVFDLRGVTFTCIIQEMSTNHDGHMNNVTLTVEGNNSIFAGYRKIPFTCRLPFLWPVDQKMVSGRMFIAVSYTVALPFWEWKRRSVVGPFIWDANLEHPTWIRGERLQ